MGLIVCDSTSLFTLGAASLLLLYTIYMYFVDKYMFLRIYRQAYYASPNLDFTVHYLFTVPLSLLFLFPLQRIYAQDRLWLNVLAFVVNTALVLTTAAVCQRCQRATRHTSDIPYTEVASFMPCNYFNSNPVHVLRALHWPNIVVPPIYPYSPGKEYLQGGQFADYDDEVRLRETLMRIVKNPLKGLDDFGNPQDFG